MRQHKNRAKTQTSRAAHIQTYPERDHPTQAATMFAPQALITPDSVMAMQRTIGNAAAQRLLRAQTPPAQRAIQREPEESVVSSGVEAHDDYGRSVDFDSTPVDTYEEGLEIIRDSGIALLEYQAFFKGAKGVLPTEVEACLATMFSLLKTFTTNNGVVSYDDMERLIIWYQDCKDAADSARIAKGFIVQGQLMAKQAEIKAAQAEFEKMEPALRDLQHQVFLSDQPEMLITAGDAIAAYMDTVETIKDTALKVETAINHVESWKTNKTLSFEMAEVTGRGKAIFETAGKIKSTYEKLKKLSDTIDLLMPQRTENMELMNTITLMGMLSDFGIPMGGDSLPLTGYPIGPMINNAKVLMGNIQNLRSAKHNREAIDLGLYDNVIWKDETGGRKMFSFMLKTMRASSAQDIPELSEHVTDCFLENADRFNAALGGVADIPVRGAFVSSINADKIKHWVFKHRKSLWGALYGSAQLPS